MSHDSVITRIDVDGGDPLKLMDAADPSAASRVSVQFGKEGTGKIKGASVK